MKYFKGHTIKLIILLFITTLLSANIYPHYDKKDFLNIEKQNGEISKIELLTIKKILKILQDYLKKHN